MILQEMLHSRSNEDFGQIENIDFMLLSTYIPAILTLFEVSFFTFLIYFLKLTQINFPQIFLICFTCLCIVKYFTDVKFIDPNGITFTMFLARVANFAREANDINSDLKTFFFCMQILWICSALILQSEIFLCLSSSLRTENVFSVLSTATFFIIQSFMYASPEEKYQLENQFFRGFSYAFLAVLLTYSSYMHSSFDRKRKSFDFALHRCLPIIMIELNLSYIFVALSLLLWCIKTYKACRKKSFENA